MAITHFSIFGLSGVGKTTFVEQVCHNDAFFQPCQTVTRTPRPDDNRTKFEYVSKEVFIKMKKTKKFFIKDCQGRNYYGYQKNSLELNHSLLLYGLPAKLNKTKTLGGICILIVGEAQKGLKLRNDSFELQEQRSEGNRILQTKYYGNPKFLEEMDLILTNKIGEMEKVVVIFKIFVEFKRAEIGSLHGNITSLLYVLRIYHQPLEGMRYNFLQHQFYIYQAFRNRILSSNFYSNVIRASTRI